MNNTYDTYLILILVLVVNNSATAYGPCPQFEGTPVMPVKVLRWYFVFCACTL